MCRLFPKLLILALSFGLSAHAQETEAERNKEKLEQFEKGRVLDPEFARYANRGDEIWPIPITRAAEFQATFMKAMGFLTGENSEAHDQVKKLWLEMVDQHGTGKALSGLRIAGIVVHIGKERTPFNIHITPSGRSIKLGGQASIGATIVPVIDRSKEGNPISFKFRVNALYGGTVSADRITLMKEETRAQSAAHLEAFKKSKRNFIGFGVIVEPYKWVNIAGENDPELLTVGDLEGLYNGAGPEFRFGRHLQIVGYWNVGRFNPGEYDISGYSAVDQPLGHVAEWFKRTFWFDSVPDLGFLYVFPGAKGNEETTVLGVQAESLRMVFIP